MYKSGSLCSCYMGFQLLAQLWIDAWQQFPQGKMMSKSHEPFFLFFSHISFWWLVHGLYLHWYQIAEGLRFVVKGEIIY